MLTRILRWPLAITALAIILCWVFAGPPIAAAVAMLAVLEVSLSFDNAVVNAKVLGRMNPYWQRIFLTVGIAIAVFGMRLLFPIIVVSVAAHLSPGAVFNMALYHPNDYAGHLLAAHPAIAGFGGMFLLLIFLDFLFEPREVKWLPTEHWISGQLIEAANKHHALAVTIAALATVLVGFVSQPAAWAMLAGLGTYLAVATFSSFFEGKEDAVKAGVGLFVYLEVLDASFSFDGVTGAFAISNQILVIALGLGLGALFVRSLTVYLVRAGKLAEYRYLEHGAHYAIGALAILLLVSIRHDVPELVTGLIGVLFIGAAFAHSLYANKRETQQSWLAEKSGS